MINEDRYLEYSDLYDRVTVDKCRGLVESLQMRIAEVASDDPERQEKVAAITAAHNVYLWITKGESAERKAQCIREWQERYVRQEKLVAEAESRDDVYCLRCREKMRFTDKHLDTSEKGDRVIMFYECLNDCTPRRAFYNDGREYRSKPRQCSKCQSSVSDKASRKGDLISVSSTCERCGHVDTEEIDLSPRKKENVDDRFAEDRVKYCLSDEELRSYRDGKSNMEKLAKFMKELEARKQDAKTEERVINIKMLRVIELQEFLVKTLEPIGFMKIEVSNPTTADGLRVRLTAFDSERGRTDSAAMKTAKAALETALEKTNWRIVKGSVGAVLGAVSGELHGYANETEVRQLLQPKKSAKDSWKVDGIIL